MFCKSSRNNWWLSAVASGTNFANVNNNGNANNNNASNSNGVRLARPEQELEIVNRQLERENISID